jgi:hypothetical protein
VSNHRKSKLVLRERQKSQIQPLPYPLPSNPYVSSDDSVRPHQHIRRNRQTDLLRGLETDHQLKLHGLLDRQISGLRAIKDFVHIRSGAAVQIGNARAIARKPPDFTYSRESYIAGSRLFTASLQYVVAEN